MNEREIAESQKQIPQLHNKKFGLTEFLKEFQPLFVILGVFGALSFYLTSLFSNRDYNVLLFVNNSVSNNQSVTETLSNNQNIAVIGKVSLINNTLPNTPIIQADPIITLQNAMFCSFLFFFLVLAIIIKEAYKIDSISKWIVISIMDILFVTVAIYLINIYALIGIAVFFGIFFCLVMFGYYLLYKMINEKIKSKPFLEKFLFVIEPAIWLTTYGIVIVSVNILNAQNFSDQGMMFAKIVMYFATFGIFGGAVLTMILFYYESLNEIIQELPRLKNKLLRRG
ncbi:MAG: hypothetical protein M0Q91_13550 [Methanoregula sp.]|nr:hypothetical protein [Methanoregula sp.]